MTDLRYAQISHQKHTFGAVYAKGIEIIGIGYLHTAVKKTAEMAGIIVSGACGIGECGIFVKMKLKITQCGLKRWL